MSNSTEHFIIAEAALRVAPELTGDAAPLMLLEAIAHALLSMAAAMHDANADAGVLADFGCCAAADQ